ncbi:MAG: Crp/Fnr family transcriptional regulator [Leptolyngbyaceae cyanobacterium SM1_1_3]|nr:Crp/Fnr family transcriptional regulator [Leptolyngbyaceae cyanobacterium SM1_1_3]NJN02856.1 Crp/Fnr family transcriptional regulator [Leptolyngbyaceae cyanobacterium RM1_1_2]NJO09097.1 Crp/Fnr family transcriptional regulator [Leptolyngbyaceae cyanobacterium SL_1_1]
MAKQAEGSEKSDLVASLQQAFLFRDCDRVWLNQHLQPESLSSEKLYSNRPVFTAFRPDVSLESLYVVIAGGPVVVRSTPLDRIIAMTYAGSCFGMRNLMLDCGPVARAFPSLVEAYKTTDVIKVPAADIQALYQVSASFRQRYGLLFELREKFQYHLLNCSTYPPQAVAALLRSLIYQERSLGNQPQPNGLFVFDLPVDLIARACQLNHRTVEQVLKGMMKIGLLQANKDADASGDLVIVADPEGLKAVYGATRDKVSWWPLR